MKNLKNWFKERNNWHYLKGGLTALLVILVSLGFRFAIDTLLLPIPFVIIGAVVWEWARPYPFDYKDVLKDCIGGAIVIAIAAVVFWLTGNFNIEGYKL